MFKKFDITRLKMTQIENARHMVRKRFPELVEVYLRDVRTYLQNITDGLSANDMPRVQKNAHAIKSSSASLGVISAHEVARELENIAKEPELQNTDEMQYLSGVLKEAIDYAEPILNDLTTSDA